MLGYRLSFVILLFAVSLSCGGCDLLLRILQKEMVEEQELFGDTYKYNSKVEELQRVLRDVSYNPGSADGKMGHRTRSAVKVFQKDRGLKVSGYVDKKTWKELNRVYREAVLSFEKSDVKQIQAALENAGFDPGPIDGKLGSRTKRAIKEFQKLKGLTQNGEVDSQTCEELRKYFFKLR